MTLSKSSSCRLDSSTECARGKEALKRSDSAPGSTFKYPAPCSNFVAWKNNVSDGVLQPTTNRRRYMRRGSKCPSMLQVFPISKNVSSGGSGVVDSLQTSASVKKPTSSSSVLCHQQRRLSMMTALKMSLEKVTVMDPQQQQQAPTAPTQDQHNQRHLTSEERRKSTYELLSQL